MRVEGFAIGGNFDAPAIWNHYPTEERDPDLSHAGAATEPLVEFDPVAYTRGLLKVERQRNRYAFTRGVLVGIVVGVVLFSVAVGVWGS